MNCRSAESLFSAFLDDALSQAERRSFEAHVLGCRRCSISLREFKGTLALLGDAAKAPAAEVGPHFDDDLMARIRSGEAMRPSMIEWLRGAFTFDRLRPALAAGATVCVLVVAAVALWPRPDDVSDAPSMASQEAAPATEAALPSTDVASAGVEDAGAPAVPSRTPAEPPARTPSATPATLAASTPSAPAPRSESGADASAPRPLAGDAANGIVQVVDRVVPGTQADLDSALPNPGSLFTDEYVTDQFYLQRTGIGPQQPTSVPVSDRGSDDVYIEF